MDISLEQLLEAGVHFGHQTRRWNPRMAPYIYGDRDGVHIFDLAKTREAIIEAMEAVSEVIARGGVILFVGTKRQAKDIVRDAAVKVDMPYVTQRWMGGTLTNFEQIRKSLKKLEDLKEKRKTGALDTFTKKERLLVDRDIARLEKLFGGLATLKKVPQMLFIVDTHKEISTLREANRLSIPVVGITDTNSDPTDVDYPIPGNDDAVKSILIITDCIVAAVEEGKKKASKLSDSVTQ